MVVVLRNDFVVAVLGSTEVAVLMHFVLARPGAALIGKVVLG